MKAPRTKIADSIASQTLKGGSTKHLSRQIAAYLLSERRVDELDSIMRDVQSDWAEAGYVEVIATSSHDITVAVRDDIKSKVKKLYPAAKKIILTEHYDPAIIGGVKLSLANQQLDLSVQAKLNKFKQLTSTERTT